jgi:hypothetical protein
MKKKHEAIKQKDQSGLTPEEQLLNRSLVTEILTMAVQSLWNNKLRTGLTMLGMVIGTQLHNMGMKVLKTIMVMIGTILK